MTRPQNEIMADAEVLYDFHSFETPPTRTTVMIVAGSHDLRVADYAAEEFLSGYSDLMVCSGGFGKVTSGIWDRPEGAVFAERCAQLGVPTDKILIEDQARNSGENFTLSHALLADNGVEPTTGTIVCKPYMARRAWATAAKQWPGVHWYVRPPQIAFKDYPTDDTPLDRMINLMVGDLQRLRVYAENGFQEPVEIPDDIWAAYERLVADGYTDFVIV